jgi:hypothetical protein
MVAFSIDHFKNSQLNFSSSQFIGEKNLSDYIDFAGEKDDEYYLQVEQSFLH